MTPEVTIFYKTALFFWGFGLISCQFPIWNNLVNRENPIEHKGSVDKLDVSSYSSRIDSNRDIISSDLSYDVLPSSTTNLESDRLSSKIFPSDIIDLLSPKIFSQPDPVLQFLESVVKLPFRKVHVVDNWLTHFITYEPETFPARYLPYAKVLRNLLNILGSLSEVKQSIKQMRRFLTSKHSSLPTGLLSPELAGLFSSEIFTDTRPPVQFMIKLITIPIDKINDLKIELKNLYNIHGFPYQYYDYVKKLSTIVQNDFVLRRLKKSISELEDFTSSKSSDPDHFLDHSQINEESRSETLSKNGP